MNATQKGILALIKSALTDAPVALPQEFDMEQAYPILRRHSVVTLAYAGALCCGVSKQLPAMQQLRRDYFTAAVKSEGQMAAIRALREAFDAAGIDYMTLKGTNLKGMYPTHEYRIMGDADILIRVEQYPKIQSIMERLGYEKGMESDHELVWNSKTLHLELHKRLISRKDPEYFAYYGDGWGKATVKNGSSYAMTPEDEYIYLFTHFAKHYRGTGVGLRQLVDLWVYRSAHPNLDEAYLHQELEKLKLLEFYGNVARMLQWWFSDGEPDEKTEFITQVIFHNGNWGDAKKEDLSEVVRGRGEAHDDTKGMEYRLIQKIFPPMSYMRYKYPAVKKAPVLLPVFWGVRWADLLLHHRKRALHSYKRIVSTTEQEIDDFQQALEYVGLRFEKE